MNPLADFALPPHIKSPRWLRCRIFANLEDMHAAMREAGHSDRLGSVSGEDTVLAAHCGEKHRTRVGEVFLVFSEDLLSDAVHELTHAAIYYVQQVRGMSLTPPNTLLVSEAEELLAQTVETYYRGFCNVVKRREANIRRRLSGWLDPRLGNTWAARKVPSPAPDGVVSSPAQT